MGDQPLQCQWPVGHRHYRSVPGGGGGCCFSVPARWTPGMTVRVDWETGVGDTEGSLALVMMKSTLPGLRK
ncbi:DUF3304 domain-containing protein [Klebsiella pneumoniae]|nr:DUF3304 domain-containing protein [Klebsiella pneumoniae]